MDYSSRVKVNLHGTVQELYETNRKYEGFNGEINCRGTEISNEEDANAQEEKMSLHRIYV